MSIRSLQIRLTQVGVIRLGEQRISKNDKPYPAKLETFRLTSPSRDIIAEAARLYGGEVRDWPDGPSGPEFQVITKTNELPVYVLPQRIDPNLELWGNGYKARFCDGETERIRNAPCLCEAAARQRYQRAGIPWPEDGKFTRDPRADCKPTTRLSVLLSDVSDGQWKVESHGWNAAAELPAKATVYLALARKPVPATLRLKVRKDAQLVIQGDQSEKVEPREYVVPELDFGNLFTARLALTGGLDAAVQAALEGQQQRPALGAAPADESDPDWLALIAEAQTAGELQNLRNRMQAAGVRDRVVVDAWKARGQALVAAADAATEPTAEVVEAQVEPDRDATWTAILAEAKTRGWNLPAVRERYAARMGHDVDVDAATGWTYEAFLTAVQAGEVR